MKQKLEMELKRNVPLNPKTHLLTFGLDGVVCRACRPGQFFNLRALDSTSPLLLRPISICDARAEDEEIDFLLQVIGEGTRQLSQLGVGSRILAVGPLGTAFEVDPARPALIVAGGVGVAPVHFLARRMRAEAVQGAGRIVFCYGARTEADFVLLDRIEKVADELVLTTEDGTRGERGFVTTAATAHLGPDVQIVSCGPPAMMNALLGPMRERGLEGQFSLENQMGCGVGACMGCVVPGREGMIRVCCDGPVVATELLDRVWSHGEVTSSQ
ncbi:dihydroorotate dehydrogenase electron transfer subunit [bacterium]|nr:dihydroorotate dehydrogenase electron transfer subunit [bacterium]